MTARFGVFASRLVSPFQAVVAGSSPVGQFPRFRGSSALAVVSVVELAGSFFVGEVKLSFALYAFDGGFYLHRFPFRCGDKYIVLGGCSRVKSGDVFVFPARASVPILQRFAALGAVVVLAIIRVVAHVPVAIGTRLNAH